MTLDISRLSEDLGRLARQGDYDWKKIDHCLDEIVKATERTCGSFAQTIFKPWLFEIRESYTRLLLDVSLDALDHGQSHPILINDFLIPHLARLLNNLKQEIPGVNLDYLLDQKLFPINTVLAWIEDRINRPIEDFIFPQSTGSDRVEKEKLRKWKLGIDTPSNTSIILLNTELQKRTEDIFTHDSIAVWLLSAAALQRIEKILNYAIRPLILQHLKAEKFLHEASSKLIEQVHTVGETWPELRNLGARVWSELWRTTPKHTGDQARTWTAIDELQALAQEKDPTGKTTYHYEWMKARWYALSGQYPEALHHYEKAFELATYRAGHQIKEIITESACLAGLLKKRAFLKQLKHVGIAMGLFHKDKNKDAFEDWEFDQFSDQLPLIFPNEGRFPETHPDLLESEIKNNRPLTKEKIDSLKPDLKNPNRVRTVIQDDGSVCRWPQLRLFAAMGNREAVEALLAAGADTDQLDSKGASALLVSLRVALETSDRMVLDVLLKHEHSSETLNIPTPRQRYTPLYRAIELGQPDVVQQLLLKGAKPDCHFLPDKQTALYFAVSLLSRITHPQLMQKQLFRRMMEDPDLMRRDVLRRQGITLAGSYGDNQQHLQQHPELLMKAIEIIFNDELHRHSKHRLTEIICLLLTSGANPNAAHSYPVPGRTPLMLAAESDLVEVFALMVEKYAGKPLQADAHGQASLDIARSFKAWRVQRYLEQNRRAY
ncbi:MAG: ankyrin repeat domain-containing protein [Comamonas sp.]